MSHNNHTPAKKWKYVYTSAREFVYAMECIEVAYKNKDLQSLKLWVKEAQTLEFKLNTQAYEVTN